MLSVTDVPQYLMAKRKIRKNKEGGNKSYSRIMWTAGLLTIGMLIVSNIFMTFAWYGHLKLQSAGISSNWPLWGVILFSWMIALAEYSFQVPANRMGFEGNGGPFSLMQLKVMQEAITLVVFTIFTVVFFRGETLHWNHFAAFGCLLLAVYFVFMK